MLSFSRNCPKNCGLSAIVTTAFCTVLRVTSAGRLCNWLASSCLVHDIPKSDVAGVCSVAFRRRVKYEKSSLDLLLVQRLHLGTWGESYAWAPSERAMKGRKDQSLSIAGSAPFSTPNQLSISGPLGHFSRCFNSYIYVLMYRAW